MLLANTVQQQQLCFGKKEARKKRERDRKIKGGKKERMITLFRRDYSYLERTGFFLFQIKFASLHLISLPKKGEAGVEFQRARC